MVANHHQGCTRVATLEPNKKTHEGTQVIFGQQCGAEAAQCCPMSQASTCETNATQQCATSASQRKRGWLCMTMCFIAVCSEQSARGSSARVIDAHRELRASVSANSLATCILGLALIHLRRQQDDVASLDLARVGDEGQLALAIIDAHMLEIDLAIGLLVRLCPRPCT